MISTILWRLNNMLSLKTDVYVPLVQQEISKKNLLLLAS
jgi:hypothetical protein